MQQRFPFLTSSTLLFVVVFCFVALGLDLAFSRWIIMKAPVGNETKLNRLLTDSSITEVPIFGSSKARSAFIPDSLGDHVFNYGMEKCGFDIVNFLLEIELSKQKNTPIFIEYNHRSFISAPSHTINIATYIPNLAHLEVRDFLRKNDRLETRYKIPGLRYFGSYFYYLRYYFKQSSGSHKIVADGGVFTKLELSHEVFKTLVNNRLSMIEERKTLEMAATDIRESTSSSDRMKLEQLNTFLHFTYSPELVTRFKYLIERHPERTIYLVYTPQHQSELQGIENLNEMRQFYRDLAHDFPNIEVMDFSELAINDSGFKNSSHLNLKGAQIFSSALKKELNQRFWEHMP